MYGRFDPQGLRRGLGRKPVRRLQDAVTRQCGEDADAQPVAVALGGGVQGAVAQRQARLVLRRFGQQQGRIGRGHRARAAVRLEYRHLSRVAGIERVFQRRIEPFGTGNGEIPRAALGRGARLGDAVIEIALSQRQRVGQRAFLGAQRFARQVRTHGPSLARSLSMA